MYINLVFQTIFFYILLKQSCSFTFLFNLCIRVNCCSIISQVIIYLKVLKRWISILNLALFCSTLPVTLLVVGLSRRCKPFLLCVEHIDSFTHSACSVLASLCSLYQWNLLLLIFHSPRLLQYFDLDHITFKSVSALLLLLSSVLSSFQPSHAITERTVYRTYTYINK